MGEEKKVKVFQKNWKKSIKSLLVCSKNTLPPFYEHELCWPFSVYLKNSLA